MRLNFSANNIVGLLDADRATLQRLVEIYNAHSQKNDEKEKYYEGKISLGDVNLGIALPSRICKLEIGCAWGAKTVDVLAARSMFDGFVSEDGEQAEEINRIFRDNNLISDYAKATRDELKIGCTFATLSSDDAIGCKIRFHSARTAAAEWDGENGRIANGLAIIDNARCETIDGIRYKPSLVYIYTPENIIALRLNNGVWRARYFPHKMGRPLMEPLVYNATNGKPLGRSRIKEPIRRLIQGYVRTIANATIGLEFATSPQKYLLGVTDDQFDAIVSDKFRQYVGSIITSTTNPETGEKPSFGQLPQGNIQPHVEMLRVLATQFSAASGLTVTDVGVVNDANPTSSDAILAQSQTLVAMAQELNASNGNALRNIALMALAISHNKTLDDLTDEEKNIMAHFKNPAMPSVSVTADAAIKIATSRPAFASTDTFLEMVGFSQADIRRIKAQEQKARGLDLAAELEGAE